MLHSVAATTSDANNFDHRVLTVGIYKFKHVYPSALLYKAFITYVCTRYLKYPSIFSIRLHTRRYPDKTDNSIYPLSVTPVLC
jgi:hypothetical protein